MSPKCQEVWRKNMFFFGYLDTWIPKICQVSKKNGIQEYPRVSMTTPRGGGGGRGQRGAGVAGVAGVARRGAGGGQGAARGVNVTQ